MILFFSAACWVSAFFVGDAVSPKPWWSTYNKQLQDTVTNLHQTFDSHLQTDWGDIMNAFSSWDFRRACDCQEAAQQAVQPLLRDFAVKRAAATQMRVERDDMRRERDRMNLKFSELKKQYTELEKLYVARKEVVEGLRFFHGCSLETFSYLLRAAGVLAILLSVVSVIAIRCWSVAKSSAERLAVAGSELKAARAEIEAEYGCTDAKEEHVDEQVPDFPVTIEDKKVGPTTFRRVRIECPGVVHQQISIDGAVNGCIVTITGGTKPGMSLDPWVKRLQFRPSEGFFEFQEDVVELERGVLMLSFRAKVGVPPWSFRFPRHFDFDEGDKQMAWMMSTDTDGHVQGESSLEPAEEPPEDGIEGEVADGHTGHEEHDDVLGAEIDTDGTDSDIESEAASSQDFEKL